MSHLRILRTIVSIFIAIAILLFAASIALAKQGNKGREPLEVYTTTISRMQLRELIRQGYDIAAVRGAATYEVDLVLTNGECKPPARPGLAD